MKWTKALLVLALFFAVFGCSSKEETPSIKQTEPVKESRGVVDEFSKKIELNGKMISLPTTLKELGDDYEFADADTFIDYTDDEGNQCTMGKLLYKGKNFATIDLLNESKKDLNNESIVSSLFTDSYTPQDDFMIGGLKKGMTREDAVNKLGIPVKESGRVLQYFNSKEKSVNERIVIQTNENNEIISMVIGKYPDGWKGKD